MYIKCCFNLACKKYTYFDVLNILKYLIIEVLIYENMFDFRYSQYNLVNVYLQCISM